MSDDAEITPHTVLANVHELTMEIARFSGSFDWCKEKFYRSVTRRHGDVAELVDLPTEVLVDHVQSHLRDHAVEDRGIGQGLDDLRCGLEQLVIDGSKAEKNLRCLFERYAARMQAMAESEHEAKARVAELTERLKEHALNDADVRDKVWAITGGRCFYCEIELVRGMVVEPADQKRQFHVDHLVPKILGGPDHIANYVPACHSCNSSKHARHFAEFVMSRKAQQAPPQLTLIEGGAA